MKLIHLFCVLYIILASACSSGSEGTRKYPSKFYNYTPSEQNSIRSGQVKVGFDEDQVLMALGKPDTIRPDPQYKDKRYVWEYKRIKLRPGTDHYPERSIPQGRGNPTSALDRPVYSEVNQSIFFGRSTKKVVSIRSYNQLTR